jgi:hypothetical protein
MFLGVLGVVIYVDPFERDFVARSGVMEFSAVDSKYNIIFGHIFLEKWLILTATLILCTFHLLLFTTCDWPNWESRKLGL